MSEIKKQVIKEIIARLSKDYFDDYEKAVAILAIPGLAVVDRGVELPLPRSPISIDPHPDYYVAQQDMLKAGWVKEER